jgi:hypothetical protein
LRGAFPSSPARIFETFRETFFETFLRFDLPPLPGASVFASVASEDANPAGETCGDLPSVFLDDLLDALADHLARLPAYELHGHLLGSVSSSVPLVQAGALYMPVTRVRVNRLERRNVRCSTFDDEHDVPRRRRYGKGLRRALQLLVQFEQPGPRLLGIRHVVDGRIRRAPAVRA